MSSASPRTVGGVVEGEVQKPNVTPSGLFFKLTDGRAKLSCKSFVSTSGPPDAGDFTPRQPRPAASAAPDDDIPF